MSRWLVFQAPLKSNIILQTVKFIRFDFKVYTQKSQYKFKLIAVKSAKSQGQSMSVSNINTGTSSYWVEYQ